MPAVMQTPGCFITVHRATARHKLTSAILLSKQGSRRYQAPLLVIRKDLSYAGACHASNSLIIPHDAIMDTTRSSISIISSTPIPELGTGGTRACSPWCIFLNYDTKHTYPARTAAFPSLLRRTLGRATVDEQPVARETAFIHPRDC